MATLYESYATSDGYSGAFYGADWHGQTFTPAIAHTITSIKCRIFRDGTPGTVTGHIRATSGGVPTGADVASGTTDGNTLPTATPGELREITLGAGTALSAGVQYALFLSCVGSAGNALRWVDKETSPDYAGGSWIYSSNSGSSFTADATIDLLFEDWGNPAGWANVAKVLGVAAASIAKVDGVAVASIAKVSGVAV